MPPMPMSRLFIALYPSEETLKELSQLNMSIAGLPTLKFIPKNQNHLTLCFLGEINLDYVPMIKDTLKKLVIKNDTSIKFESIEYGANPSQPNLIWLKGQNMPWVLNLWQELKTALRAILPLDILDEQGQKSLMNQHFLSHITLARFHNSSQHNLPVLPSIAPLTAHFENLALIESVLTSEGPIYNILENIALKP